MKRKAFSVSRMIDTILVIYQPKGRRLSQKVKISRTHEMKITKIKGLYKLKPTKNNYKVKENKRGRMEEEG